MAKYPKTVEVTSFAGLNNVLPPERTPNEFLKVAENIDIDKSGGIHKRPGYSLKLSGNFHSLWGDRNNFFAVKDGYLVRIRDDYTTVNLIPYVGRDRVSFTSIDTSSDVFFTSKNYTGHIIGDTVRSFGYQAPPATPHLVELTGSGSMDAGRYQVVTTYSDMNGEESGAGVASIIDIQAGSSIKLPNITPSPDNSVSTVNIYASMPNGDILYKVAATSNVTGSYIVSEVNNQGVTPLKSFNISPAPYGAIIRYYRGRVYVADDNVLWFSSPFSLSWFNQQTDFFQFEQPIKEVMPVENGIWVGTTDGLYYLGGKEPDEMKINLVEPVKVIPGTGERIVGAYLFIENTPIGYKWLVTTDKGVFVCFNNGIALNMTETNVAFPDSNKGVSSFIQKDGINRYLTLLEEKEPSNNTAATDIVTATVIRNGIVI